MNSYLRQWRLLLTSALALVVLVALGTWQVQRLHWKQNLIAKLEYSVKAKPVSLADAEAGEEHGYAIDWLRVTAAGYYRHDLERHVYGIRNGRPGWRVLTPLVQWGQYVLLVDRGFVPEANKLLSSRPDSAVAPDFRYSPKDLSPAEVPVPNTVTGVIRLYSGKKPLFAPDNQPDSNQWYWHDLQALYHSFPAGLGQLSSAQPVRYLPFVVQLQPNGGSGNVLLPAVDPVNVKLPNNHLGYAITWYGIAIGLVFVVFFFARSRRLEN